VLSCLAATYAMLGQPDEGLNSLDEALRLVESSGERWWEAGLSRLRGDLLLATQDPSAAEPSYRRALLTARKQSAKLLELQASTSLARLWNSQGKRAEAEDLLAPIHGWFTEGFDAPDLVAAKTLLEELALPSGPSVARTVERGRLRSGS
jgi:predicted ATPase